MIKTPWIAGAALAAMLGATGYAYAMPEGGPPKTRTDVQARIAEHFKKADANGDGQVTKAEADTMREAMKAKHAGQRAERREQHFAKLDADKNGALSKEEFAAPRQKGEGLRGQDGKHRGHHGGRMMRHHGMGGQAWFDRADVNKDGKISLAEASAGPLAMFDKVDSNKDGSISPDEREAMHAKWRERRGDASKR